MNEPTAESATKAPRRATRQKPLDDLQLKALHALFHGAGVVETAEALGVSRGTLWRWHAKNPAWAAEWQRRLDEVEKRSEEARREHDAEEAARATIRQMAAGAKHSMATLKACCLVLGLDFNQKQGGDTSTREMDEDIRRILRRRMPEKYG